MITVLVVGTSPECDAAASPPSIEILRARDGGQAVERLARNRRIDAVLLLAEGQSPAILAAIGEQELSPPPIYTPRAAPAPGTRPLDGVGLAEYLAEIAADLGD